MLSIEYIANRKAGLDFIGYVCYHEDIVTKLNKKKGNAMKTTPRGDLPPQVTVNKSEIRMIGSRTVAVTIRDLDKTGVLKPIEKNNQAYWDKKNLKDKRKHDRREADFDIGQKSQRSTNGDDDFMQIEATYTGNEVERP